jgi:hypothetical protein
MYRCFLFADNPHSFPLPYLLSGWLALIRNVEKKKRAITAYGGDPYYLSVRATLYV